MHESVGRTLLIVEDDDRLRELLLAAAERTQVFTAIETAPDGQAALDLVWNRLREKSRRCPDYILSDLSMPRMDGIQLIKELKRFPETSGIPVTIITSSNLPNDREDATAAGCCAFFHKPIRLDEMTALIASVPDLCPATAAG
jgi:CheY-like chemotaxis protein